MTFITFILYVLIVAFGVYIAEMLTFLTKYAIVRHQQKKIAAEIQKEILRAIPISPLAFESGGQEVKIN